MAWIAARLQRDWLPSKRCPDAGRAGFGVDGDPARQGHVERHRGAENRGGLLGIAHLNDAALLREGQTLAAQGVAQIMHGQDAETLAHHRLLECSTGLFEGFRRVEDEERIHG